MIVYNHIEIGTEHENGKETETENFFSFPFLFQAYVLLKFHDLSTMLRLYKKYHSNSCPVPVSSQYDISKLLHFLYNNSYWTPCSVPVPNSDPVSS